MKSPAPNERFTKIAAVSPQEVLWKPDYVSGNVGTQYEIEHFKTKRYEIQ